MALRSEGAAMSQEILFFLFMTCELIAIMALYTFWIIPRVALKTNNLFEERMLDKSWDIPAMLEDYTEHLAIVFSEIIKKLVPQVIGGVHEPGKPAAPRRSGECPTGGRRGFPRFFRSSGPNGGKHGITTHPGSP